LRFTHKTSKNRRLGGCEPSVRFTLQTPIEPLVRAALKIVVFVTFFAKEVTKTYKSNRLPAA
jgi:hypothetical protein